MPMIGPNITNGLGAWGIQVTFELNPLFATVVTPAEIAEVKVFVIADGGVTLFVPDVPGFRNDETSFHKDETDNVSPQHTATGLDPAADPPSVFVPQETTHHKDEGVDVSPQHTPTGLDPAADPSKIWEADQGGDSSPED